MKWLLVAVIAAATTISDVLQAAAMKKHGEIRDFRPGALGRVLALLARNKLVVASVAAMTISFFAFIALLSVADLSSPYRPRPRATGSRPCWPSTC